MTHELKCWPEPYAATLDGTLRFTFRRDDRNPKFALSDTLKLNEWTPDQDNHSSGTYTGNSITATVTYIARAPKFELPNGYVVMGLSDVTENS